MSRRCLYVSQVATEEIVGVGNVADNLALGHGTNAGPLRYLAAECGAVHKTHAQQRHLHFRVSLLSLHGYRGVRKQGWSVCCFPKCGEQEK